MILYLCFFVLIRYFERYLLGLIIVLNCLAIRGGQGIRHVCPQYPLGWVPFGPKIDAVPKGTETTFFIIFPRNSLKKKHFEPKNRYFRIFLQNILQADVVFRVWFFWLDIRRVLFSSTYIQQAVFEVTRSYYTRLKPMEVSSSRNIVV